MLWDYRPRDVENLNRCPPLSLLVEAVQFTGRASALLYNVDFGFESFELCLVAGRSGEVGFLSMIAEISPE